MSVNIAAWLRSLGLQQYEQAFRDNDIDPSVLPKLTVDDLVDLGVTSIGHRRKLLDAIAALQGAATPTVVHDETGPARRQLTMMFCDLVGSTELSTRLDPEEFREIIGRYHQACTEVIVKSGGFVARYLGDGVLAYFGYPQAHEDDAERSVRAGLALVGAVSKLDDGAAMALRVRVGIATGLVVVGDLLGQGPGQETGVVGEPPNLAARLQALAEPNTVVIDGNTHRLLGGLFEYRALDKVSIKGFGDPIPVWQVTGMSAVDSRFEALHATTTPLVGREEEIDLLMRRWQRAKAGEGCIVLVSGEPGIGKSHIVQTILERLGDEPHTRLRYFCSPHHQDSALYPTVTQLERAAGFRREDTVEQKLNKLEAVIAQATNDFGETVPLFAALLSIPVGDRYPPLNLSPQKQKEKTLRAKVAQIEGLAARRPVLMVFEDIHWSDPTSLELLDLVIDRVATLNVLVIVTFRPDFTPSWAGRSHVTHLSLNRLPPRQRAEIIARVTRGKALPKEIVDQIIDRTDGVPLFIEELTKTVVESGILTDAGDRYTVVGPLRHLAIPTSLNASLLARLDRLAPAREVAQIGAALGRQFLHEMISAVAQMRQQELDEALEMLVRAELIFRRGTMPDAEYTFKHALVQDAAYSTLLRSRRQQLHARIASIMESQFPEIVAAQPELVAQHCTEAGLNEKALGYWLKAGQQAVARSANAEALSHFARGLELLKAMPDSTEVRQQEIKLLTTRAVALRIAKGYGSDELFATLVRARDLCQLQGDPHQMFQILFGLWTAMAGRGDWLAARALGEECLAIARKEGEAAMLIEAHRLLGSTAVYMAEHPTAERELREALDLYKPEKHRANMLLYGYDPGTICNGYLSWNLWLQGKVSEALAASETSIRLAIESQRAPNIALAYGWATFLHLCTHDLEALRSLTPKLIAHCEEHGLPHWLALGKIGHGWCLARTGNVSDGIEQMKVGIEEFRSLWGGFLVSAWLVCFADALRTNGEFADAKAALKSSLGMIERFNERLWEAENYRVRGEVARDGGQFSEALIAFEKAINVARNQSARSLELRAANSFAKLLADQGERRKAHDLLAPIYSSFIKGFDMPELKEAKTLLENLT